MFSTVIITGRSGCGKGTQAKRLVQYWQVKEPKREFFYLETGALFRDFVAQPTNLTTEKASHLMASGQRLPDFLAVWNWTKEFIERLTEDKILIIDGAPRSLVEAQVLDTAFEFYERSLVAIVLLNVSRDWAKKRLLERGRSDDNNEDISQRLGWFDEMVQPAINFYRQRDGYIMIEINGEQDVDAVTRDLVAGLWSA